MSSNVLCSRPKSQQNTMKPAPVFSFTCRHSSYSDIDPTKNQELSLSRKSIFITGATSTIGAAIAESFAQAGAGNIIITGRNLSRLDSVSQKLRKSYQSQVHPFELDLKSTEECCKVVEEASRIVGNIDVLVLNAAHLHEQSKITSHDFDLGDFFACFEVNVKGNLALARAFLRFAPPNATIINITSFMAYLPPFPYAESGYSSSKAAFAKVLEYLHAEQPELRIFNLHPGSVVSDMLVKCGVDSGSDIIQFDDPALPGCFCVWLASPRADFLNGKTVEAMWDVTELEKCKDDILADPRALQIGLTSRGDVPLTKK